MGVVAECGGDGEAGTDVVAVAANDQLAHDSSITNSEIMIRLSTQIHTESSSMSLASYLWFKCLDLYNCEAYSL
jgi:hypothetical protein